VNLAAEDADALRAAEQAIELVQHADAAAGEGGKSRSGDPKLGERPPAENEAGVEEEIDELETHRRRMAIAASPAPRKMALLRKRSRMAPLPRERCVRSRNRRR